MVGLSSIQEWRIDAGALASAGTLTYDRGASIVTGSGIGADWQLEHRRPVARPAASFARRSMLPGGKDPLCVNWISATQKPLPTTSTALSPGLVELLWLTAHA